MKEQLRECIGWLKAKGVDYADCRWVRQETEQVQVSDENVDVLARDLDVGVGIRVIYKGAWGFAATAILTPGELRKTTERALQVARASAMTLRQPVRLAEQKVYVDSYKTVCIKDPFGVPAGEKLDLLLKICGRLRTSNKIRKASASMGFYKTGKLFVSTEGAEIEQEVIQSGAGYEVISSDGKEVQKRSFPNSHRGDFASAGYEFIEGLDLLSHVDRVREEAIQLLSASPCPNTNTTVIITSSQMALQVHESCGHPTELDRVLGTEISLAGGSFMTQDKLGKLKYGSDIVSITADATISGGLGSFGYDDEGVKCQRAPLIEKGMFVGYLSSRETAPVIGSRSNGTMRADGWNRIPLIRMTNVNLEPGQGRLADLIADTKDGLLFDMNKSWSIDDKRLNFQFGVECAWEIKAGRLGQMFKNPVYTGITPEFWNSCDAICGREEWHLWGVPNCGKGEPMQTARVSHGTSAARFHNVKVGVSK